MPFNSDSDSDSDIFADNNNYLVKQENIRAFIKQCDLVLREINIGIGTLEANPASKASSISLENIQSSINKLGETKNKLVKKYPDIYSETDSISNMSMEKKWQQIQIGYEKLFRELGNLQKKQPKIVSDNNAKSSNNNPKPRVKKTPKKAPKKARLKQAPLDELKEITKKLVNKAGMLVDKAEMEVKNIQNKIESLQSNIKSFKKKVQTSKQETLLNNDDLDFSPLNEKRNTVKFVPPRAPQKDNSTTQPPAKDSQLLKAIRDFNKKLSDFENEKNALWSLDIAKIKDALYQQNVALESVTNSDKSQLSGSELEAFDQATDTAKKTLERLDKMLAEKDKQIKQKQNQFIEECESAVWNLQNLTIPQTKKYLDVQLTSVKDDVDLESMNAAIKLQKQSIDDSIQDLKNPYHPGTDNFNNFQRKIDTIFNEFSSYIVETITPKVIKLEKSQTDDNSKRQEKMAKITLLTDIDTAADADNNNSNLNKNIDAKLKELAKDLNYLKQQMSIDSTLPNTSIIQRLNNIAHEISDLEKSINSNSLSQNDKMNFESQLNQLVADMSLLQTDAKNPLRTVDSQQPQVSASQNKDLPQINAQHNLGQPIFNVDQTSFQKLQQSDQPILNASHSSSSTPPSSVSASSVPRRPAWVNPDSIEKIPNEQDNTMYEGIENLYVSDEEKKLTEQFEKLKNKITEELPHTSSINKTLYEELLSEVNKTIKDLFLAIDSKEAQTQLEKYNEKFNEIHALDNDLLNKILTDVPENAPIRNQVTSIHKDILNKHFSPPLSVKDENEQIHILQKAKSIEATEAALPQGTNDLASSLFAENQYRRICNTMDVALAEVFEKLKKDEPNRKIVLAALEKLATKENVDLVVKNIKKAENLADLKPLMESIGLDGNQAKEYFVNREKTYFLNAYQTDEFVTKLLNGQLKDNQNEPKPIIFDFSTIKSRHDFHIKIQELKRVNDQAGVNKAIEELTSTPSANVDDNVFKTKLYQELYNAAGPKLQKYLGDNQQKVEASLVQDYVRGAKLSFEKRLHLIFKKNKLDFLGTNLQDKKLIAEITEENTRYTLDHERLNYIAVLLHGYHQISQEAAVNEASFYKTGENIAHLTDMAIETRLKRGILELEYKHADAVDNQREKDQATYLKQLTKLKHYLVQVEEIRANYARADATKDHHRDIYYGVEAKIVKAKGNQTLDEAEKAQIAAYLGAAPAAQSADNGHLSANITPGDPNNKSSSFEENSTKTFNPQTEVRVEKFIINHGQDKIPVVTSEKMKGGNLILEHHVNPTQLPLIDEFKRQKGQLLPHPSLLNLAEKTVKDFARNSIVARNGFTIKGEFNLGDEYVRAIMLVCAREGIACYNQSRFHEDINVKPTKEEIKAYKDSKAQTEKLPHFVKKKSGFLNMFQSEPTFDKPEQQKFVAQEENKFANNKFANKK